MQTADVGALGSRQGYRVDTTSSDQGLIGLLRFSVSKIGPTVCGRVGGDPRLDERIAASAFGKNMLEGMVSAEPHGASSRSVLETDEIGDTRGEEKDLVGTVTKPVTGPGLGLGFEFRSGCFLPHLV